ncbi:MAG: metallophosphoesterase [Alphaproteobacteria bacterium]|nr:metallophosphoesterase [Alphaproteobacteria bacterium]
MRPISWLHVSDIHLSSRTAWSQDVVLTAMCRQIEDQRAQGTAADFILLTGDVAYSGKSEEYALAADFLNALCVAASVPKERVFCIPGNHDIDRDRQRLCFCGARATLRDPSRVDAILEGGEDLETLLERQANYRDFQRQYFSEQERTRTADGLGYVSWLTVEDVRFAIIGLDSAWLACGGVNDHGKLLVGERQVIDACRLARQRNEPAHIVIAMIHHPLHLLQDFDRRTAMNRVEEACHFLHCGHLHEPEARMAGAQERGCLTIAAGASFETRQSHNGYSIVTLDLVRATRRIDTFQYNPSSVLFSRKSSDDFPIEVTSTEICDVGELAYAMREYDAAIAGHSYYLSVLVLDRKADFVIPLESGHSFASFAVLQGLPASELKERTEAFLRFRNVLRVLNKTVTITEIFVRYGHMVAAYDAELRRLCDDDAVLRGRLDEHERDARILAAARPARAFSHTKALLGELADERDWFRLHKQASRHMESHEPTMRTFAMRMMALSLANSEERAEKTKAAELYRAVTDTELAEFSDVGNLSILLVDAGDSKQAKEVVLEGLKRFPSKRQYFSEIGQHIVEATGDKGFRGRLEAAMAERENGELRANIIPGRD